MYRENNDKQMEEVRKLLKATNGKFFHVQFIKKDGSLREMTGRLGVKKFLKGGSNNQEHIVEYENVYDIDPTKGYRTVNLKTVQSFKCGNVEWPKKEM